MPSQHAPRARQAEPDDCRCLCGSLLARLTDAGVELKCRRCKRTLLVPLEPPVGSTAPRRLLEVVPQNAG